MPHELPWSRLFSSGGARRGTACRRSRRCRCCSRSCRSCCRRARPSGSCGCSLGRRCPRTRRKYLRGGWRIARPARVGRGCAWQGALANAVDIRTREHPQVTVGGRPRGVCVAEWAGGGAVVVVAQISGVGVAQLQVGCQGRGDGGLPAPPALRRAVGRENLPSAAGGIPWAIA